MRHPQRQLKQQPGFSIGGHFNFQISYMAFAYGFANHMLINKLRGLQNGVLRSVMKVQRRSSTTLLYKNSNVLQFDYIVKSQLFTIPPSHVCHKKLLHLPIVHISQVHSHHTRSVSRICLPPVSSTFYGLQSILFQAIKIHNSQPMSIKQLNNQAQYKLAIKKHFKELTSN